MTTEQRRLSIAIDLKLIIAYLRQANDNLQDNELDSAAREVNNAMRVLNILKDELERVARDAKQKE